MLRRLFALLAAAAAVAAADDAPKRVLYFTLSAGFRHDSIPLSRQVLEDAAVKDGRIEIVWSEDPSVINAENLERFDAVFFFTSGELPFNEAQKAALLDFVRRGKGFGGVHSATDTCYGWPAYGELIGGRFDGHPWTQEVGIVVEDADHPATHHLAPGFRILDEIYQFREFSRERVNVLMRLDTNSVDVRIPGVNRVDHDFALAWSHEFGSGRVFYTALGHFDETWRDVRFQKMLVNALLWITKQEASRSVVNGATPQPKKSGPRSR